MAEIKSLAILGATGSIGSSTLDVVQRNPERYRVHALAAHRDVEGMTALCQRHHPELAAMASPEHAEQLRERLAHCCPHTEVLSGPESLNTLASLEAVDIVVAAIVGAAGMDSTLAAVQAGKRVLLANKESLVLAGELMMQQAMDHGACLIPVDSEHNAIFQCLPIDRQSGKPDTRRVAHITLTASGGPFRGWSREAIARATPDEACAHPNWSMGRKISVDSATLMNKGLELIEARWLFDLPPERLKVVVHPQSIIHSTVAFVDGSTLAQLGLPDMRTPIAAALAWPDRIPSGVDHLDLSRISQLDFEPPDTERFPCLQLAYDALKAGGTAAATLNAANEVAVQAFLDGGIGLLQIAEINQRVMQALPSLPANSLEDVRAADQRARQQAEKTLSELAHA